MDSSQALQHVSGASTSLLGIQTRSHFFLSAPFLASHRAWTFVEDFFNSHSTAPDYPVCLLPTLCVLDNVNPPILPCPWNFFLPSSTTAETTPCHPSPGLGGASGFSVLVLFTFIPSYSYIGTLCWKSMSPHGFLNNGGTASVSIL